jgi:hypothetical protein
MIAGGAGFRMAEGVAQLISAATRLRTAAGVVKIALLVKQA